MYLINCMAGSTFVGFFFLQYSFAWITAKARQIQQMCMQQYFHWISWPKEDRILYLNAKGSSMCVYTFTYIYMYCIYIFIHTEHTYIYECRNCEVRNPLCPTVLSLISLYFFLCPSCLHVYMHIFSED